MNKEQKRMKELNDKYDKIYNEKYSDVNLHNKPSPETIIRLKVLEDNQVKFMEKLDKMGCILEDIKIKIAELPEKVFEKADERYAEKKVEQGLEELKDKIDNRNYEWLKYVITAIVGAGLALLLAHLTK